MTTDKTWRVMCFENAEGKSIELASNHVGPEAVPVPPGYKFVSSVAMVLMDESGEVTDAMVDRACRVFYADFPHRWPTKSEEAVRRRMRDALVSALRNDARGAGLT